MTSHSGKGSTADRVLINADTEAYPRLVNSRFAYVAISRARHDVVIFTNDSRTIAARVANEISKPSALVSSPSLPVGGESRTGRRSLKPIPRVITLLLWGAATPVLPGCPAAKLHNRPDFALRGLSLTSTLYREERVLPEELYNPHGITGGLAPQPSFAILPAAR